MSKETKEKMTDAQIIGQQVKISDTVEHVPINKLKEHPLNDKFFGSYKTAAHFSELTASIKKHGVLEPAIAMPDGLILSGHSRRLCATQAGEKTLPVRYVESDLTSEEQLEIMVRINLDSMMVSSTTRLEIYEESIPAFRDLMKRRKTGPKTGDFGSSITPEAISKKFKIPVTLVKNDLYKYSKELQAEEARNRRQEMRKANVREGVDNAELTGASMMLTRIITKISNGDLKTGRKILKAMQRALVQAEKAIVKLETEEEEQKRRRKNIENRKKSMKN